MKIGWRGLLWILGSLMKQKEIIVSCVVDSKHKYYEQCIGLINSLLLSGTVKGYEIVVHVFEDSAECFVELLKKCGVNVFKTKRFEATGSVFCNKLIQLKSKLLFDCEKILLMDTDIAVVENIRDTILKMTCAAKVADTPSPPIKIFRELYRRSSLSAFPCQVSSSFCKGVTVGGNCNGGVYIFSKDILRIIAPLWLKWSYWCLHNKSLLGHYIIHADQISFSFALLESGLELEYLDLDMNYPTHLKKKTYTCMHNFKAKILHYHSNIDDDGFLNYIGLDLVDGSINIANEQLKRLRSSFLWRDFISIP